VAAGADTLFRTAFGYPTTFVASVFAEARCDLAKALKEGAGGGAAQLTMRDDGRVARVSLVDTDASQPCMDAVRALFMTYVLAVDARREGDTQQLVMVPFTAEYAACQNSASSTEPVPAPWPGGIEPPTKIRDVKPIYPASAQSDRVSGIVIAEVRLSSTGCVYNARVLRGADPRLDWAALRAVSGWAFTPTRVNGVPTPTIMTVTVSFTLN
jgi:TonB family protein